MQERLDEHSARSDAAGSDLHLRPPPVAQEAVVVDAGALGPEEFFGLPTQCGQQAGHRDPRGRLAYAGTGFPEPDFWLAEQIAAGLTFRP